MYSLRKFGGEMKHTPVILYIEEGAEPSSDDMFELIDDYRAKLIFGTPDFKGQSKYGSWFNKCSAVADAKFDTTHGLWMDIDYYINGDFSELLSFNCDIAVPPMNLITNFGATPEDSDMWNTYYEYFNIPRPSTQIKTAVDKKMGSFYFTSSIMLYKNDIRFGKIYKLWSLALLQSGLPFCEKRFSQTSIPLIITKYGLDYKVMPRHLSYMYHLNDYTLKCTGKDPVLIHYCDNRITEIEDEYWDIKKPPTDNTFIPNILVKV